MALPMPRSQIQKLGERLAAGTDNDLDREALEELTACHLAAIETARPRLDDLAVAMEACPLHISHRPKTTGTIIEKLQRESGMSLPRMQDLAGIRIVGAISLDEQDRLAAEIIRRFPPDPRQPKLIDRRIDPRHGYRAVHVVVCVDGVSIEIQIRTLLQHLWADLMERLADRLGRQIRYGEPPNAVPGMGVEQGKVLVAGMISSSDKWAERRDVGPRDAAFRLTEITDDLWSSLAVLFEASGQ